MPKICLCAPGGTGKDLLANWLTKHTTLKFHGGTSWVMSDYVWDKMAQAGVKKYPTAAECYADRSNHRVFWAEAIDEFCKNDYIRVYREMVNKQDIVQRPIRRHEVQALRASGLIDLFVWLDRPGVPADPTQGFGSEECDVILQNPLPYVWDDVDQMHKCRDLFYERAARLCKFAGIPVTE